jgi:arginyl-tRNA synthetase
MSTAKAMNIADIIQNSVAAGVAALYGETIAPDQITMNATRKEFEGDLTVVVFPFTRAARKKPEAIGEELGRYLVENVEEVARYNVIKGFLNLVISDRFWLAYLKSNYDNERIGHWPDNGQKVMVEFSSPNTNKPLHLGHIRNILLGWSSSKILEAAGYDVVKVQIVNDRGIAICKSMLAWRQFGQGATPESTSTKSDHFVGEYYVLFEQELKAEYENWQTSPQGRQVFARRAEAGQTEAAFFKSFKNTYFNEYSALGAEAREMLRRWESGDPDTIDLWRKMNGWVYQGFEETYDKLGVSFDKLYYESGTYQLGKDLIDQGLEQGIFYRKEDGSVWIDLEDAKLDHKLVLRSDGTSVYMTQDIGTARLRYNDFGVDKMVYVVADEQNYHFQVLFEILKRMGEPYADGLYHLSYGMVDLPSGKMKSREGTVVDADDLIAEVVSEARLSSQEKGMLDDLAPEEKESIIRMIGLAALKFFIIKVHPKKRMTFDPKESVDMQGQTGPYIQNAYVRIQSILRKAGDFDLSLVSDYQTLAEGEKGMIAQLYEFANVVKAAAADYDPSEVANYCYDLAKAYHKFYHDFPILRAETEAARAFRLMLSIAVSHVLKNGMDMLGVEMPEKM